MTVTIDQAIIGALRFADNEVIPLLPDGKGIAVGVMLVLSVDEGRERLLALGKNPAVKLLRIMDERGNIDIDRLYSAARPKLENGMTVSVPLIGDLKFGQADADKLLQYIKEA